MDGGRHGDHICFANDHAALAQQRVAAQQRRFAALCASLDALSPLKVLSRGYAVARTAEGKIVKSAADVTLGERIDLSLGRGRLGCTVTERDLGGNNDGEHI